jgi:c-di-AMP phosphodiesterase-like protein
MVSLFLANVIGWITLHWRLIAACLGAFLLLVLVVMAFKSCGKREVKIDENQIQKINSQNEKERKAELERIINDNAEVIKTTDERSNIAETNRVERERLTDEKIKEVDKKIAESKAQGRDVSQAELVCLLQPTECK